MIETYVRLSVNLYRALLQLYPSDFRSEFSGQMAQCFDDLCLQAADKGGSTSLLALWLGILPDLAFSMIQEHFENRRPGRIEMNTYPTSIDRFQLKGQIGDGSISSVFRAYDPERRAEVAIKLLKAENDLGIETYIQSRGGLQREADLLTALNHPAIPRAYGYARTSAGDYMVMDYIEGRTLLQLLEEHNGYLDESLIIHWGIQICDVLDFLHTQQPYPLLFRDVKPSNVIVSETDDFHLLDFGTTLPYIPGHTYECIGTEGYAAPEQYSGREEPRSDLYALGASLHHLTTRIDPRDETKHRPFTFAPPRSINPALSKSFSAVIQRALAYEPEDRYPTAAAMKTALEVCR